MSLDNRIRLHHFVCFLEVARQRSFAKMAGAVMVSQPAISKTLKELGEILGARLFEQNRVDAELTGTGVTFLRYAGPCVRALRDGVNTLHGHEAQVETVRVGVLSTVESLMAPEVIRRLHRRHGVLVVSTATGPSAYLLAQLKVGGLDLVIGRMTDSPDIQGLTFEYLYSESMMLVVRPSHPLLAAPLDDPQRLVEFPLVLPLAGTTIRYHTDSLFVRWGIPLAGQRLETLSSTLGRSYVLRSEAIQVAPCDAVRLDVGNGDLVELDLGIREPGGSVGLCHNTALPLPLGAQQFSTILCEVAVELH